MFVRSLVAAALGALAGLLFSAVPAVAGGGCHNASPANTIASGSTVEIRSCAFGPVALRVAPGTTVSWTNADVFPHNVVGVGWGDTALLNAGDTAKHTFTTAGIYPYHCSLHPDMSGAVVVGDVAAAGETAVDPPAAAADPLPLAAGSLLGACVGVVVGRRWRR